jgi:PTS system nitrogen regulatory IIA component
MNIADLITTDRIQPGCSAQSKKRALEQISQMLAGGAEQLSETDVFTALIDREKLGSTGLGDGVAIPHGRMTGLEGSVGAFMQLTRGIDYEANDGQPVDLIFGLLVPEDTNESHLQILAIVAEMFTNDEFCGQLRAKQQPEAVRQLFNEYQPSGEK